MVSLTLVSNKLDRDHFLHAIPKTSSCWYHNIVNNVITSPLQLIIKVNTMHNLAVEGFKEKGPVSNLTLGPFSGIMNIVVALEPLYMYDSANNRTLQINK